MHALQIQAQSSGCRHLCEFEVNLGQGKDLTVANYPYQKEV